MSGEQTLGESWPRVGLALGGGAARGLAHFGVLQALEAGGVPIDYVAGVSAGAVVGAIYCAGVPLSQMASVLPYLKWRRLVRPVRSRRGLLSFDRLERWLVMMLGDLHFSDLQIPFGVVAMDVDSGERLLVRAGPVAPAVRASCSVPGFANPATIDGRLLADGGVVENLPVQATRQLGADYVIGVDIFQADYRPRWGPLGSGMAAIETMVRFSGGGRRDADHLIEPDLAGQTFTRFSDFPILIARGRQAGAASVPAILADLGTFRAILKPTVAGRP